MSGLSALETAARLEAFEDVAAQLHRKVLEGDWNAADLAAWLDIKIRRLQVDARSAAAALESWGRCMHCRAARCDRGRSFCCDRCRDCALVSFGDCTGFCELDDSDLSGEDRA